jgi:DNA-binding beta-propeller fold protein YncE
MVRNAIAGAVVASALAMVPAQAAETTARLPTGAVITPEAIPGAHFERLDPKLPELPDFRAGQPVTARLSPDGKTLLVLTSGFNRTFGPDGQPSRVGSSEYVFVYDVSAGYPAQTQVLQLPNTFQGLSWTPDGQRFLASGGVDDTVYAFQRKTDGSFAVDGAPMALGHKSGNGVEVQPMAAGLAVSPDGKRVLVANYQNDSVSLIDLDGRKVLGELDLRPGKLDPSKHGVAGGEYPVAVVWQSATRAFVASQRDREIVALAVTDDKLAVDHRIKLKGEPVALLLNKSGQRLYVANDNTDTVTVIETDDSDLAEEIPVAAPSSIFPNKENWKGANPNGLALSPDEQTLFVTDGGLNAVAVIALSEAASKGAAGTVAKKDDDDDAKRDKSRVIGLLPTGWYPTGVAISADGRFLYAINAKSQPGPNVGACRSSLQIAKGSPDPCYGRNGYVWQLEKGGLLSAPLPTAADLAKLSWQVAANNRFDTVTERAKANAVMAELRKTIKHVIYIVKENRTYDQVLGDLERGNGDPSLAILGGPLTPNHHKLARNFVVADNFFDTGETSNVGWNWVTAAHTNDYVEKNAPVNYARRGLQYDAEGTNRTVPIGHSKLADRRKIDPRVDDDDDLLPGTADVAAPDSDDGHPGAGYLWDGAIKAHVSLRNYGFYPAANATEPRNPNFLKPANEAFKAKAVQFIPANAAMARYSDPYFRSFDVTYPDFWRVHEWSREFDGYVKSGTLPTLELLRLPNDHTGAFEHAPQGFNTVEGQLSDNDYALGLVIDKVAHSRYADSTVIIAVEDDAQNGADHVDAHRSIILVAGAKVKRGALVSDYANSINVVRTIEDLIGIKPLGLNDGLSLPFYQLFDPKLDGPWTYTAELPAALKDLSLPIAVRASEPQHAELTCVKIVHRDAAWWAAAMVGQDFSHEDRLDTPKYNAALWTGLRGDDVAQPPAPDGRDLRKDRPALLAAAGCSPS